jgi:hypothetical protein
METNVTPKPKLHQKLVAGYKKHERKILVSATVISTSAAIVFRTGIHQHNDFLRERGLYDEFYALTNEATV